VELDVTLFERLVRDGNPSALERAAALYRGDLLEGLAVAEPPFEEWLTLERERLREKALEALVRLLAYQIRVGAAEPAMETAIRVLGLDPTQEAVHRSLMRLYAADGRRGAALRQYQICVGVLERELGAEPEAETKELYRELLQAAQGQRILEPDPARSEIPLIGRQLELARLHAALDAALQGRGAVALVQGEWGVGKSRLVAAVVARAAERGGHVLLGRAYESEQILPFSPWVDALRAGRVIPHMVQELNDPWRMELARLFPELGRGDTEPPAGEDYVRLFEAMTRVVQYLASGQPLLVVLEDLHWADDMSLRLLVFLSRRIPDWPVLVIGTFRVEELADALVLRRSVAQLAQQSRSLSLSLAALSERESMALVRALMRAGREESVVTRIAQTVWRVSAGNPFMVVEAVRMLEGRDPATGPEDVVIPQAVRAVIAGRLERLTDRGRRLAGVASVIGREFDFTVLSDAAELSAAETAEGVEELVGRRILQAVGEALDFTHDRIRDVAYELVLPAHRRLLHRAVAGALESRAAGDVAAQALALGRHYAAAEAWNRAWPYLAQAGARAARRYAHREAIACFEQAISALGRLPPGRELIERSIDLRLELRHSCVPVRDHDRILEHLREAEEAATSLADRHRLGWILVYRIHGLFLAGAGKGGLEIGQRALALAAEVGDPGLQESASFYLAQVHHWAGNYRQGADLLRRTVSSLEDELARLGMPAKQYVNCRMILAWCLAELGVFGEALTYAQEAIAAAEKRATAYDLVHAYSGAGLVHLRRGDFRAAATTAGRAVELCQGRDFSALWAMSASIVARPTWRSARSPRPSRYLSTPPRSLRRSPHQCSASSPRPTWWPAAYRRRALRQTARSSSPPTVVSRDGWPGACASSANLRRGAVVVTRPPNITSAPCSWPRGWGCVRWLPIVIGAWAARTWMLRSRCIAKWTCGRSSRPRDASGVRRAVAPAKRALNGRRATVWLGGVGPSGASPLLYKPTSESAAPCPMVFRYRESPVSYLHAP
jgi:tetratricopeptide (TPR) repeat protein